MSQMVNFTLCTQKARHNLCSQKKIEKKKLIKVISVSAKAFESGNSELC